MYFGHSILRTLPLLGLAAFFVACGNGSHQTTEAYPKEIDQWHQRRIDSLMQPDSWLSLAGLYRLQEGPQTFGSDSSNDFVFPSKAPKKIGTITKDGADFSIRVASGIEVLHDNSKVSEMKLTPDNQGQPTVLRHGDLLWYIIKRRDNYYIRLKDTRHPNFASFEGIERFPVSKKWHVKATFRPFDSPKMLSIPDVLGEVYQDSVYGRLNFSLNGSNYSLTPIGHPQKDEEFFIILGDKTNGKSTYGGGRYIYVPTPDEKGITYIDFNKAYNPPCVFTDFATCPLPPEPNQLDLKVTAGEKMYE